VRADVEAGAQTGPGTSPEDERSPLSGRRRAISENLSRSWREIPHVTSFESVRAERLMEAREVFSERLGESIPVEALLIKAVLPVLKTMPEFNSCIEGETIVRRGSFNIGISVDSPQGLIVPVIHDADTKDVAGLSHAVASLVDKARGRKLERKDTDGLTFTVSNIGSLGGGYGTPIIPYGTAAILSVGRAVKAPVIEEDSLAIGLSMPLSLSYDHRLIDGGTGRRFLAELRKNLEQPLFFLAQ
jgi:Pyruvate/2-oxoglutarate dehydrogenase complex, dihydrolipoamide acyltransferase (E2) component, and related enzymes